MASVCPLTLSLPPAGAPTSTLANLKSTGRLLIRLLDVIETTATELHRADPAEQEAALRELERRAANVTAAAAERFGFRYNPAPHADTAPPAPAPHIESDSSVASTERTWCPLNEERKRKRRLQRPSQQVKRYRHFLRHGEPGYICTAGPACAECFGSQGQDTPASTELTLESLAAHDHTHTPAPRAPHSW